MRYNALIVMALLACTPAAATAQTAACLSAQEADGLIRFALPEVVEQLSNSCAATLPATAYLLTARGELKTRYAIPAANAAPAARRAFAKIANLPPQQAARLSDQTFRDLMSIGIAQAASGRINPKDCGVIDAILEQLAPLPAENMAGLIGLAIREGSKRKSGEKTNNPLHICGGEGGA